MSSLTIDEKRALIEQIIIKLKAASTLKMMDTPIDEGDTFFALCFKPDEELQKIGKMLQL